MGELRDDYERLRNLPLVNRPFYGPSSFLGLIVDRGAFVSSADRFIVVQRVDVTGEAVEGSPSVRTAEADSDVVVAWLGPKTPTVGDYAIVTRVPDRWVASRSGDSASICMTYTLACAERWIGDAVNPYDTTWLKNGRVTDANGEHSLSDPTPWAGWLSPWIDFTTSQWTDGDCTPKTGDGRYRYNIYTSGETVSCHLEFLAVNCGGGLLYSRSGTTLETNAGASPWTCDPITGTFAFVPYEGLEPPVASAVVAFDLDEEARVRCKCRQCFVASGVTPEGIEDMPIYANYDQRMIYEIDDGDRHESGELNVTTGHDLPGNDYIRWFIYEGERHLVPCPYFGPGGTVGGFMEYGMRYKSGETGDILFDLVKPWDGTKYPLAGTIRVKDYDDMSPDRLCCGVCDLPPVDFEYNFESFGPDGHADKFILKYSPTKYVLHFPASGMAPAYDIVTTNWRSEPVATPWHPFNAAQVAYFGCNFIWYGVPVVGDWALYMLESTAEQPYGYPGNPDNNGGFPGVDEYLGFRGTYEITCRPWRYKLTVRRPAHISDEIVYIAELIEIEPE